MLVFLYVGTTYLFANGLKDDFERYSVMQAAPARVLMLVSVFFSRYASGLIPRR